MAAFDAETIEIIERTDSSSSDAAANFALKKSSKLNVQTTLNFWTGNVSARESSHAAFNICARDRARESEFREMTYEDGGKLFCKPCNVVIDHMIFVNW